MGTMGIIGICVFVGLCLLIGVIFFNVAVNPKDKPEPIYETPDWGEPLAVASIKTSERANFDFYFDGLFNDEEQTVLYTVNEKNDVVLGINGKDVKSGEKLTPKDGYVRVQCPKFEKAGKYVIKFDFINVNDRHVRPSFLINVE